MEIAHFITANSNDDFAVDELEALSQSFHGQNCTVVFIIVVGCCERLCQRRNQKDGSEFVWEWLLDLRASSVAMVFRRRRRVEGRCQRRVFCWRLWCVGRRKAELEVEDVDGGAMAGFWLELLWGRWWRV